jgi:hypothetical protein
LRIETTKLVLSIRKSNSHGASSIHPLQRYAAVTRVR